MKFLDEFKSFAMRGNVLDMAVGVIIGAAFGKIVSSLVDDILMPPIGWLVGVSISATCRLHCQPSDAPAGVATINYGAFLQTTFGFYHCGFFVCSFG